MIITSWQMYMLLQLDSFKIALMCIASIAVMIAFLGTFLGFMFDEASYENNTSKNAFKIAKISAIVALIAFPINVFLPSTKRMAAIIVVPAIVNNEKVQNIGNKTLDIGDQLLQLTKQYFEENLNK